ncbi:hypothetical protein WA026_005544 [Henosepilachna vigintioctopunctata]|uniref:Uncharacterized protein n=1 Tax=Henosepilachna vigintioctopunctata TaxID=420089 RepID=A0AAW1TVB5_9CUCU
MSELIIRYVHLTCQLIKWFWYRFFQNEEPDNVACLVGKTAIVTGGNSGIGYAVSTLLASRGCKVIIADVVNADTTRNTIIKDTGNTKVVTKHLNLSSLKSVRIFAKEIVRDEKKIDILVNNAGVAFSTENHTEDHLNTVMQINFFGAFLLTHLLIEPLKAAKAARVVFTGSSMAYLSTLTLDNLKDMFNPTDFKVDTSTGYMLYQNSKLCNILVAQEFGEKLRQYGIIVNCADPGIVRTKLFKSFAENLIREFNLPELNIHFIGEDSFGGARTTFHLASSDEVKETGQHFYCCRITRKPKILENRTFCNEVWKITEELSSTNKSHDHHELIQYKMEPLKRLALDTQFLLKFTWYFLIFCINNIKWVIQHTFSKDSDSFACLVGKTAIVTGGNSGIGYATSLLFASRGCKSVRSFAERIKKNEPKVDILINNAGALISNLKVSEDGLNALMQTNYFGPFLLTHLLKEPMKASRSARIVFVSSALAYTHKLSLDTLNIKEYDDDPSIIHTIYANSKLCTILAAQEFSRRLMLDEIVSYSADPGIAKTPIALGYNLFEGDSVWSSILNFLVSPVFKDPIDAAQTTFHLATSEEVYGQSGNHYFRCKIWPKPNVLYDQKFVQEIWEESEKLVQLNSNEKLLAR